jgi:hypothetical protein
MKKSVWQVEIPVPSDYQDGIFYQTMIFDDNPSQDQVLLELVKLHKDDVSLGLCYNDLWLKCFASVMACEDFPVTRDRSVVSRNSFVNIGGERYPLTIYKREVFSPFSQFFDKK